MESQMLTDALNTAQKRVESYFYDIRKNLFDYDQVRASDWRVTVGDDCWFWTVRWTVWLTCGGLLVDC